MQHVPAPVPAASQQTPQVPTHMPAAVLAASQQNPQVPTHVPADVLAAASQQTPQAPTRVPAAVLAASQQTPQNPVPTPVASQQSPAGAAAPTPDLDRVTEMIQKLELFKRSLSDVNQSTDETRQTILNRANTPDFEALAAMLQLETPAAPAGKQQEIKPAGTQQAPAAPALKDVVMADASGSMASQSLAAASTQDSQDVEMKDAQNTTALVPVDDKKLTPQERALEHALKMAAMTPEEVQDRVYGF